MQNKRLWNVISKKMRGKYLIKDVNKKEKIAEKENYKYHKSKIKAMAIRLVDIL